MIVIKETAAIAIVIIVGRLFVSPFAGRVGEGGVRLNERGGGG